MKYDKLVRDKIPEIIKRKGSEPVFYVANDEEYWSKLVLKIEEEVKEFLENNSLAELADIMEVILAICEFKGIDFDDLEKVRKNKKEARGGFKEKIILDEVK